MTAPTHGTSTPAMDLSIPRRLPGRGGNLTAAAVRVNRLYSWTPRRAARGARRHCASRARGPARGSATSTVPFTRCAPGSARAGPAWPACSGGPRWLPWPLPHGWLVTGFAAAGDDRSGTRACAVALSGPNPVGGLGELLVISEELGVGLGARFAGLEGPDPGEDLTAGSPAAVVRVGGHELPLWNVDAPGRAAFAGEVLGHWLWLVLWPDTAGVLLVEPLELRDLRNGGLEVDIPFGAPSPRLAG